MACRLFGAKPLSEPVLTCCKVDAIRQFSTRNIRQVIIIWTTADPVLHMYMYMYMFMFMYICIYVYMCVCVCVYNICLCLCLCIYVYMYICAYVYVCIMYARVSRRHFDKTSPAGPKRWWPADDHNDDQMITTQTRCLHYWPYVKGIHRPPVDSPHKTASNSGLRCLFVVSLNCWRNSLGWNHHFVRPLPETIGCELGPEEHR